jgi:hypothetical protein
MRNISDKFVEKVQNTSVMFSNVFSENPADFEIMEENMVQPYRPQMSI